MCSTRVTRAGYFARRGTSKAGEEDVSRDMYRLERQHMFYPEGKYKRERLKDFRMG